MKKQIKEIHSDSNRQKTKEKVGHEPTDEELAEYYIEDGGAETFSEKYISK